MTIRGTLRLEATAALATLIALAAPAAFAEQGRLVVRLGESFEVNGQLYPAGMLSLRELSSYNPASTLNEIWIDNECIGVLLASDTGSETGGEDVVNFERGPRGHLVLTGFAYRGKPVHALYGFRVEAGGPRWLAPNELPPDAAGGFTAALASARDR